MDGLPFVCVVLFLGTTSTTGFHTDGVTNQYGDVPASKRLYTGDFQSIQFKSLIKQRLQKSLDKKSTTAVPALKQSQKTTPADTANNMTAGELRDAMLFPDSRPSVMDPYDTLPADTPVSSALSVSGETVANRKAQESSIASRSPVPSSSQSKSDQSKLDVPSMKSAHVESLSSETVSTHLPRQGTVAYQTNTPQYSHAEYLVNPSVNGLTSLSYQNRRDTSPGYTMNTYTGMFSSPPVSPVQVHTNTYLYTSSYDNNYAPYRYSAVPHSRGGQGRYQHMRPAQIYGNHYAGQDGGLSYPEVEYPKCDTPCTKYCLFGYESDMSPCDSCTCRRSAFFICSPPVCPYMCPFGYERNGLGCDTCTCKASPILEALQKQFRARFLDFSSFFQDFN